MNWISRSEAFLTLLEAVEREFGVPRADIEGRDRYQSIALARHALWWLLRKRGKHSYPEIGNSMERSRDHTTVMSGIRRFEQHMASRPELADRMALLEARLDWTPAITLRRVRVAAAEAVEVVA